MKITDEQLKQLRASFALYDANGDGSIDRSELIRVLQDLKVDNIDKEVDKVMAELDSDGSGSISFGEFLKSVRGFDSIKEVEVDDIVLEFTAKGHKGHGDADKIAAEKAAADKAAADKAAADKEAAHKAAAEKAAAEKAAAERAAAERAAATEKVAAAALSAVTEAAGKAAAVVSAVSGALSGHRPTHLSPHTFVWHYEGSKVELAGDFTNWGSGRIPMHRNKDGHFETTVQLAPGSYEYRFIIDNNIEWYYDILLPNVLNTGSWFINNIIVV